MFFTKSVWASWRRSLVNLSGSYRCLSLDVVIHSLVSGRQAPGGGEGLVRATQPSLRVLAIYFPLGVFFSSQTLLPTGREIFLFLPSAQASPPLPPPNPSSRRVRRGSASHPRPPRARGFPHSGEGGLLPGTSPRVDVTMIFLFQVGFSRSFFCHLARHLAKIPKCHLGFAVAAADLASTYHPFPSPLPHSRRGA